MRAMRNCHTLPDFGTVTETTQVISFDAAQCWSLAGPFDPVTLTNLSSDVTDRI